MVHKLTNKHLVIHQNCQNIVINIRYTHHVYVINKMRIKKNIASFKFC